MSREAATATNALPSDRVGGEVALPVLPHHRTYGSVYGGLRLALQSQVFVEEANETKLAEESGRDGQVHVPMLSRSMITKLVAGVRIAPNARRFLHRHDCPQIEVESIPMD